jgi:hypothetical protein
MILTFGHGREQQHRPAACLYMRGGSTAQENAVLKEEQIRRLLGNIKICLDHLCDVFLFQKAWRENLFFFAGMKYVLDMQNDDDKKRLAQMIRQHKQGAGGVSCLALRFKFSLRVRLQKN